MPEMTTVRTTTRLTKPLATVFDRCAIINGMSITQALRDAVLLWIKSKHPDEYQKYLSEILEDKNEVQ